MWVLWPREGSAESSLWFFSIPQDHNQSVSLLTSQQAFIEHVLYASTELRTGFPRRKSSQMSCSQVGKQTWAVSVPKAQSNLAFTVREGRREKGKEMFNSDDLCITQDSAKGPQATKPSCSCPSGGHCTPVIVAIVFQARAWLPGSA